VNERIIEMAKQCGYWSGQTIEMNDVGITKFAELIVRECAEVGDSGDPLQDGGIARMIKQHFGVDA